ncbi:MAG: hypothetical protein KatS3mg010_0344 [Acidimicrobiia bacterium]|nr:MAG: hypothetical protein KatS3mg010_0344 [Acidimicrobiia bacterium]
MNATPDVLAVHAQAQPDRPAVIADGGAGAPPTVVGFAELNARVNRLANGLVAAGARPGERLVWCGPNSLEVLTTIHAARKLGLVAVPLSYRFTAEEMAYVVDNSDATTVVVDAEQAPLVAEVREGLTKVRDVRVVRRRRARGVRRLGRAVRRSLRRGARDPRRRVDARARR